MFFFLCDKPCAIMALGATVKRIRDILVLIFVMVPVLVFAAVNAFILWFGDLIGLVPALDRIKARSYHPRTRRADPRELSARMQRVLAAFELDGYDTSPQKVVSLIRNGVFGLRLTHKSAHNTKTGVPKYAYYFEGTPYEIGFFTGRLAEPEVSRMSVEYVDNVVFAFAGEKTKHPLMGSIIAEFIYRLSRWNDTWLPRDLTAEIYGIWEGAHEARPASGVRVRDLFVLNYGIDVILGYVYAGVEPILKLLGIKIEDFVPPFGCNAFTIRDELAEGGMLFGRDFMFPTCGIFGDTGAHAVIKPVSDGAWYERKSGHKTPFGSWRLPSRRFRAERSKKAGERQLPNTLLVFFAPGMVGSVFALNQHGLAMGLDMVAGRRSNWRKVGLNSLCLVRYAVSWADDATELGTLVADAPRGISWLYPFASAKSKAGGVIEAACKDDSEDWLRYTPKDIQGLLPSNEEILQLRNPGTPNKKGMFVRLDNYDYPAVYLDCNAGLYAHYKKQMPEYPGAAWDVDGELNTVPHGSELPKAYYFAPLRQMDKRVMVACNHYIVPEMRISGMNEWTTLVPGEGHYYDDFQWRYDRLCKKIHEAILGVDNKPLDFEQARELINFLHPYDGDKKAEFWSYYGIDASTGAAIPPADVTVGGSTSIIDCGNLKASTLWGMYADEWAGVDFGRVFKALEGPKKAL